MKITMLEWGKDEITRRCPSSFYSHRPILQPIGLKLPLVAQCRREDCGRPVLVANSLEIANADFTLPPWLFAS